MLESEFHISRDSKASLVSIICPKFAQHKTDMETQQSLIELRELLRTLGIETGYEYVQRRKQLDPATLLGQGKLKEIAARAKEEEGSSLLVFDFELSASQFENIKKLTTMAVVDRVHVILEIFARHARTREAKIQIEISRLQYLLPRLAGFWSHLGRQRGGVGVRGGEGEQQIELDRRIIRSRIDHYKKELEHVRKARKQQGKKRRLQANTVALVGYTNAGKSSLMNRLCKTKVLEENKLFATLDSTFRNLAMDVHPPIVLIDTVGFISNLPSTLIDGFKTTLESALEADLLVVIVDISSSNYRKHLKVTGEVLEGLGMGKKDRIVIFNKKDLLNNPIRAKIIKRIHRGALAVSSFVQEDMTMLRDRIVGHFLDQQQKADLFIPYGDGEAHSVIAKRCNLLKRLHRDEGTFYRLRAPESVFTQFGLDKYTLDDDHPGRRLLDD